MISIKHMPSRLPPVASAPGPAMAALVASALLISGCSSPASTHPTRDAPVGVENLIRTADVTDTSTSPSSPQEDSTSQAQQAAQELAQRIHEASAAHHANAPSPHRAIAESASWVQWRSTHQETLNEWAQSVNTAHDTARATETPADDSTGDLPSAEADTAPEGSPQEDSTPEDSPADDTPAPDETSEAETNDQPEAPDTQAPADESSEADDSGLGSGVVPPDTRALPETGTMVPYTGDLQSYVDTLASAHPGNISVSLRELGGQQRTASSGGSRAWVTASTYKAFVAYSIIRQVESGNMSWSDSAVGGRDLKGCFFDMIALSDNPCPEAIGPEIGWTTVYADAEGAGARSTGQGQGAIVTSADDLTSLLSRLEAGSLNMSATGHEALTQALGANIHRQGIPAGSAGQVFNKPGFINGYLHDAAIVRHPQGTYVLSIMSEGSSWDALASLTAQIEAALYG